MRNLFFYKEDCSHTQRILCIILKINVHVNKKISQCSYYAKNKVVALAWKNVEFYHTQKKIIREYTEKIKIAFFLLICVGGCKPDGRAERIKLWRIFEPG